MTELESLGLFTYYVGTCWTGINNPSSKESAISVRIPL